MLPMMLPMALGSLVVGLAYSKLDALDPMGLNPSRLPPPTFAEGFEPGPGEKTAGAARYTRNEGLATGGFGSRVPGVLRGPYRRAPAPEVRAADIPASSWWLFALGFLLVASGPTSVIVGLGKSWKDDFFLLLRADGMIHQTADGRHHLLWDHVARIEHDAGVVRLRMRDDSAPYEIRERYAGIDARGLASRLEELRRKASFGLLPR